MSSRVGSEQTFLKLDGGERVAREPVPRFERDAPSEEEERRVGREEKEWIVVENDEGEDDDENARDE